MRTATLTRRSDTTARATHRQRRTTQLAVLVLAAMVSAIAVTGIGPTTGHAGPFVPVALVPLGLASTFGALGSAAFSATSGTTVRGDVGGSTATFAPATTHVGAVYLGAAGDPARADLAIAYTNARDRPAGAPLPGAMAGLTVGPGVHTNPIAGNLAAEAR